MLTERVYLTKHFTEKPGKKAALLGVCDVALWRLRISSWNSG